MFVDFLSTLKWLFSSIGRLKWLLSAWQSHVPSCYSHSVCWWSFEELLFLHKQFQNPIRTDPPDNIQLGRGNQMRETMAEPADNFQFKIHRWSSMWTVVDACFQWVTLFLWLYRCPQKPNIRHGSCWDLCHSDVIHFPLSGCCCCCYAFHFLRHHYTQLSWTGERKVVHLQERGALSWEQVQIALI